MSIRELLGELSGRLHELDALVMGTAAERDRARANFEATSGRAEELARRVSALEVGLTEALECLATHDDEHPYLVRLRALVSGT